MSFGTPYSYLEEQTVQPLSVNAGATALPVFVGYTEQAIDARGTDLTNILTPVGSMLDYRAYFGGAAPAVGGVTIDADGNVAGIAEQPVSSYLYQSIDLYFRNGGGNCCILSVGDYGSPVAPGHFENALSILKGEEAPTLLVFTDALLLNDADYYALCRAALAQCSELGDRFAILDVKDNDIAAFRDNIGDANLGYGAAYYPYLNTTLVRPYDESRLTVTGAGGRQAVRLGDDGVRIDKPSIHAGIVSELNRRKTVLPPGAAVAAAFQKADNASGPWKAPANIALKDVTGPSVPVNHASQETLNVSPDGKSINAIRSFTNRGTLIWGARTLDGNSNDWRYVPVRRLFIKVESEVRKSTAFAVFEPNNSFTWLKIKTMLIAYLEELWSAGALNGATADEAYFVRAGLGETMDEKDIEEGRLHVSVGIAAARPAEFVVITITHILQNS